MLHGMVTCGKWVKCRSCLWNGTGGNMAKAPSTLREYKAKRRNGKPYQNTYTLHKVDASLVSANFTAVNTFLTKKIRGVIFYEPSTLVCQFLFFDHFIETSTTKGVFLWYRSQRALQLICKFGMTLTWIQRAEKSSCHSRDFPVVVRNELIEEFSLQLGGHVNQQD